MSPFDAEFVRLMRATIEEVITSHAAQSATPRPMRAVSTSMLTTREVGERCGGKSAATVLGWIHRGTLKASRPGHEYLIAPAELDRFLAAQSVTARPKVADVDEEADRLLARLGAGR